MRFEHVMRLDKIGTTADNAIDLSDELGQLSSKIADWNAWTEIEMEALINHQGGTMGYLFYTEDPTICEEFPEDFERVSSLLDEDEGDDLNTDWKEDDLWD